MKGKRPKAICVLGMHRSGTSVITRAVNLLGVYLGEEKDLMAPKPDNPLGFWERDDIYRLQEDLLHKFRRDWAPTIPPFSGRPPAEGVKEFREKIAELIKKNFVGKRLWGWKDPRTCILLDIWKDVLKNLGIDLSCLIVVRNPLDVARSLEKRNGYSQGKGFGIWFSHNVFALKSSADLPRAFVSYDRFLNDWEGELRRCAAELGIPWPEDDTDLKEEMKRFLRPDLRHSYSSLDDLREGEAPRPVVELYELLSGVLEGGVAPDEAFNRRIEKLYEEFSSYAVFFHDDMKELWERNRQVTEQDRQIARLNQLVAEKEAHIQALLNSWSWKVTAPMRKVLDITRKTNPGPERKLHHVDGPIIVHNMGKVGSLSIVETLKAFGIDTPIYHSHILHDLQNTKEKIIKKARENNEPCLTEHLSPVDIWIRYRGLIEEDKDRKWNIITPVRDPVAQRVSQFFHAVSDGRLLHNGQERLEKGEFGVDELYDIFLKKTDTGFTWFEQQFEPVFGIDVYSRPFPHEKGYDIFKNGRFSALVIRLEDLDRSFEEAMREFLGLDGVKLLKANIADKKWYADIYREFLSKAVFPDDYLDTFYNSKFARHFYTPEEITRFRARWKKSK